MISEPQKPDTASERGDPGWGPGFCSGTDGAGGDPGLLGPSRHGTHTGGQRLGSQDEGWRPERSLDPAHSPVGPCGFGVPCGCVSCVLMCLMWLPVPCGRVLCRHMCQVVHVPPGASPLIFLLSFLCPVICKCILHCSGSSETFPLTNSILSGSEQALVPRRIGNA